MKMGFYRLLMLSSIPLSSYFFLLMSKSKSRVMQAIVPRFFFPIINIFWQTMLSLRVMVCFCYCCCSWWFYFPSFELNHPKNEFLHGDHLDLILKRRAFCSKTQPNNPIHMRWWKLFSTLLDRMHIWIFIFFKFIFSYHLFVTIKLNTMLKKSVLNSYARSCCEPPTVRGNVETLTPCDFATVKRSIHFHNSMWWEKCIFSCL